MFEPSAYSQVIFSLVRSVKGNGPDHTFYFKPVMTTPVETTFLADFNSMLWTTAGKLRTNRAAAV